jgi:hypothetical protein
MKHVLSTHLFVNHRLTSALLGKIQQAGIPAVEIFCARQHLDYRDKAQIGELGHWFRDSELKLHSLHSPMYNDEIWGRSGPHSVITITEPVKSKRLQMVDEHGVELPGAGVVEVRELEVAVDQTELRELDWSVLLQPAKGDLEYRSLSSASNRMAMRGSRGAARKTSLTIRRYPCNSVFRCSYKTKTAASQAPKTLIQSASDVSGFFALICSFLTKAYPA